LLQSNSGKADLEPRRGERSLLILVEQFLQQCVKLIIALKIPRPPG